MEKVLDAVAGDKLQAVEDDVLTLDAVAREGARRMLLMALEEEVARYVDARNEAGRCLVVCNGRVQARSVACGTGAWGGSGPARQ